MKYTTIEERLNAPISFLKGVNPAIKGSGTVAELIARIKNGDAAITHKARKLRVTNLPLYKTTKKFDFEGFLPGRWTKRDGKHSVQYVPLFAFDIDKIALSETGELSKKHFNLLQKIRVLQHVFMAYATPSGGIRFLVWCNKATWETHEVIYMDMLDFFSDMLRIPILKLSDPDDLIGLDPSTHKAVSFFFFTPDADVYTNYESQNYNYYPPLITDAPKKEVKQVPVVRKQGATENVNHGIFEKVESNEALASLPAYWEQMEDLDAKLKNNKSGDFVGRHERVLYLAVNFRENNIPEEDAIDYCVRTYEMEDSDKGDTARTVKDVYKKEKGYKSPHSKKSDLKPIKGFKKAEKNSDNDPFRSDGAKDFKNIADWRAQTRAPQKQATTNFSQMKFYLLNTYDFRRNCVKNKLEYSPRGLNLWEPLNENDLICEIAEEGIKDTKGLLVPFLYSSLIPEWDPFLDYLDKLPEWDGVDHIAHLASFVKTSDDEWWNLMLKKHLVRQVAGVTVNLAANKQGLTLFGLPNNGKTKFANFLLPKSLATYTAQNPNFLSGDKDAKVALGKNWQIVLDEVGNFSEMELKNMKSTFSMEYINERLVWDKDNTFMPRRATFVCTTDKNEFLTDERGNVRFVVIEILSINHDSGGKNGYVHLVDMDKVYAQAYYLLKKDFKHQLSSEEIQKSELNNLSKYMKISKEDDLILKYFSKGDKLDLASQFMTAADITIYLEQFSKNVNHKTVGSALSKLKWERVYKGVQKGYYVKVNTFESSDLNIKKDYGVK